MTPDEVPADLRVRVVDPQVTVVFVTFSLSRCADLTPAELEVARCAVSGMSNRTIARWRGSSVRTVANQLASVFRKLGVGSRAELVTVPEVLA
ncbi:MAG TPA: helix-turn-helix transcriptional regulator [Polyangiaceae bacterium]|jgi:DNA-binding CsgD family transcriptional regulator